MSLTSLELTLGTTRPLSVTLYKNGVAIGGTITYTSSAPSVFVVSPDGVIFAEGLGTGTLTVSGGGQTATVAISVVTAPTTSRITGAITAVGGNPLVKRYYDRRVGVTVDGSNYVTAWTDARGGSYASAHSLTPTGFTRGPSKDPVTGLIRFQQALGQGLVDDLGADLDWGLPVTLLISGLQRDTNNVAGAAIAVNGTGTPNAMGLYTSGSPGDRVIFAPGGATISATDGSTPSGQSVRRSFALSFDPTSGARRLQFLNPLRRNSPIVRVEADFVASSIATPSSANRRLLIPWFPGAAMDLEIDVIGVTQTFLNESQIRAWAAYMEQDHGAVGPSNPGLFILGDSITFGTGASTNATQYASLVTAERPAYWVDRDAYGGRTLAQANTELTTEGGSHRELMLGAFFPSQRLNTAVVYMGTNDVFGDLVTGSVAYSRLLTVIATLRANGADDIVVPTPIDRQPSISSSHAELLNYITAIRNGATANNYRVADLYADSRLADATNLTYFLNDQIHPTDAGHRIIATIIEGQLTAVPPTR